MQLEVNVDRDSDLKVDLFNASGQLVRSSYTLQKLVEGTNMMSINLDRFTPGVYTIQVRMNEEIFTKKLIILQN